MESDLGYARKEELHDDDDDEDSGSDIEFQMKKKGTIHEEKIKKETAGELGHAMPPEKGLGETVLGGLRKLWATSMTEDIDERDTKKLYRLTLRQFIIYLGFLAILCAVAFGMIHPKMYYYTKVMSSLFIDTEINRTRHNFRELATKQDLWQFLEVTLLDGLYWKRANGNPNVTEDETYIYNENKLLGVPRLRQLKVRKDSCTVHEDFKTEISECYDVYSEKEEQQDQFGLENGTAWVYQTSKELAGTTHVGLIAYYGGGGYVQNLAKTKAASRKIVRELRTYGWIDRGTRVVFIDFTVYNANVNLFCVIRIVAEFPATGGVIPTWKFHTVKLIRYTTVSDYVVFACEIIFVLYLIYYTVEEIIEIKKHQFSYFKHFWSIIDFVMILFGYGCAIFSVYRYIRVNSTMETLLEDTNAFLDFEFLAYWQINFNNACAILVFLAWLKMFKVINFNRTMTQLSTTVARCAKDLIGFAIMFVIIFLAFAQLGYLIFGTQVEDFKTFATTMFTLFRILLGDFDFHSLEESNRYLGPAYFVLYVFFIFFVLLNMFLAIINDSYSEAKDLIPDTKITFGMGDYIKMGYKAILTKLKFKREKLGDMKLALQAAHVRHDRVLTLGDWKQDLISRGYKTEEITAVFEKYDTDHDGRLTVQEQKQLEMDLNKQEETLASEFRDLDAMEAEDEDIDMSIHGNDLAGVSSQEFLVLSNEVETISNRMEVLEVEVTKVRGSIKKILKHLGREEIWT